MFKDLFVISKVPHDRRNFFFKKYRVFDGMGSVYFSTIKEARSYVYERSCRAKELYNSAKSIFKSLHSYYLDSWLKYKSYRNGMYHINEAFKSCFDLFEQLCKRRFADTVLSQLNKLYSYYLFIANSLDLKVMSRTVSNLKKSFFVEYPVYRSSDCKNKVVKHKLNSNVVLSSVSSVS